MDFDKLKLEVVSKSRRLSELEKNEIMREESECDI